MNIILLLSIASLNHISSYHSPAPLPHFFYNADTGIVSHVRDGLLNEWPAERFTDDKETGVKYAIDNDGENLYIAMNVPDKREQVHMMRAGMKMFVDIKGKKREGRGIEFPVEKDYSYYSPQQIMMADISQARMMFAQSLLALRLFGFTDGEPTDQSLAMEGSGQVVFSWDANEALLVEYTVPLAMLEKDVKSLDQKQISIGWKVNSSEAPQAVSRTTTTKTTTAITPAGARTAGVSTSGVGSGSGPGQSSSGNQQSSRGLKEQLIWTKYTVSF